ncbi:MAG: bifunctional oligoribonuclease/PAP phosphatase NrnA [Deltaproteobacteria bacterium]|nr:bifunctional oligoribonuclease/PAP phosphatase NrnA [Deltaproteobacteria bacterium]
MDTTLGEAGRLLASSQSIMITTHVMPDGDGLGAEIALYHYLKRLGKNVRVMNPDPVPARYQFLDKTGVIEVLGRDSRNGDWSKFDLAVVVDTNDPRRIGALWQVFEKHAEDILIFDHHPHLEESSAAPTPRALKIHTTVDVKSSSIGELLYRLFHQSHDLLDPNSSAFRLTPEIALGLYVSIITDTNSFRYSRTTALSHRIAADLIDYGLQPEEIYQNVYSTKAVGHLRLIGEVLGRVCDAPYGSEGKTVAWVEIPRSLRQKYGASSDDTQTIVNFLLLLKSAEILVLIREEDDGTIKVSLKSKGTVKVSDVAQEFGGGGHDFAAGFNTVGRLEEVRDKLIARLSR